MAKFSRRSFSRALVPVLVILWLGALIPGLRSLRAFERSAGKTGPAPAALGLPSVAGTNPNLPLLVVALHPLCSCSRATLEELEKAASRFNHPYDAVMLIYQPRGTDYRWQDTSLYRDAQRLLRARLVLDNDGQLAATLGVFTSGHVLYYSAAGNDGSRRLLFSGGVTGSRGMVGENAGIEALQLAVNSTDSGRQPLSNTNVFGCGFAALSGRPENKLAHTEPAHR